MGLDIRIPMGLMFTILGVMVTGYGVLSDRAIYQRSLGINVFLWLGRRGGGRAAGGEG
jgi:hypothetical protein